MAGKDDDEQTGLGVPANIPKASKQQAEATGGLGVPAPAAPREDNSILPQNDILANSPDDGMVSSALKLAGTAISSAPFAVAGLPGDLRDLAKYGARRLKSYTSGKSMEDVTRESEERDAKIKDAQPSWMKSIPSTDSLPTTDELHTKFLAQAGTKPYEPQSLPAKIAMGVLKGAAGARNAVSAPLARGALPEMALRTAEKTAPIAGVAGGVGAGVADITGDPLLGAGASILAAPVAAHAQEQAGKHMPAITKGQVSDLADTRIKDLATDPNAAATADIHNPLGTKATTGESVGDQGLIQAKETLAGVDPTFKGQVKKIEGQQNAKRVETIEDLAHPNAKASDVVDHYNKHLEGITTHADAVIARAQREAESVASTLPEGQAIDVLGGKLQETANARMKQARDLRNRAYEAVDPDGTMHVVGTPATSGAQKFLEEHDPSFGDLHPTVKNLYEKVAGWKDVVPYKGVMQMDATINGAIGEARAAQNHTVVDQLGKLKTLVKGAADKALENQVKWEQQQVAAGAMPQEQTIGYRLAEEARAFRDARRSAGTSAAVLGTGTAGPVRDVPGGGGTSNAGSAVPPGAQGVAAAPTPNMDPAAAVAWTQAKQLHGDFSDTFRQGQVGDAIKGQYGRFDTPGSKVAQQAFVAGDAGAENVRNWMRADNGATDIPSTMADIAATRLREMMKGNEALTPEVLAAWKAKYAPALSAIDERVPGFSERFDNAASATQALGDATAARADARADFEKGMAKRFLGKEGDDDVGTAIGKMIGGDNSAALTRELMANVAHNVDARRGVQRAVVDWLLGKTSNAGIAGGENILSGAKFPKLVNERADALRNIFGDAGYENMVKVMEDLRRSGAAQGLATEPNSNTAMKLKPLLESIGHNRDATIGSVMVAAAADAIAGGGLFIKALIPIMIGKATWNHVKQAGIRNANDLVHQGLLHPEIGQAMLQRATAPDGKPNMAGFASIARALSAQHATGAQIVDDKQREGRAEGGAVRRFNPAMHAAALVREAEKVRKQHGTQTEALLKVPDEHIARALSVANGAING